jgi:hypothetical protein
MKSIEIKPDFTQAYDNFEKALLQQHYRPFLKGAIEFLRSIAKQHPENKKAKQTELRLLALQ